MGHGPCRPSWLIVRPELPCYGLAMESKAHIGTRIGSLDCLRGIAILLVVLFHSSFAYPSIFGHDILKVIENQGVQLFFLVSAFTMCAMWDRRRQESHPTMNFYIRRFFRIAPLYWGFLIIYGLLRGFAPWPDILANLIFVHSLVPSAINSVVPGGWSIGVEIAFYLIFPLAALLKPRFLIAVGFAWYLIVGIGVETLLKQFGAPDMFLYYSPLTQFPVFAIGMYVYHLLHRPEECRLGHNLGLALVWLVTAALVKQAGLEGRPFFWLSMALWGVVVALFVRHHIAIFPLTFFGRISYSMYLVHFAVIELIATRFGAALPSLLGIILIIAASALLAYLSFISAEVWSQQLGRRLVRRSQPDGAAPPMTIECKVPSQL